MESRASMWCVAHDEHCTICDVGIEIKDFQLQGDVIYTDSEEHDQVDHLRCYACSEKYATSIPRNCMTWDKEQIDTIRRNTPHPTCVYDPRFPSPPQVEPQVSFRTTEISLTHLDTETKKDNAPRYLACKHKFPHSTHCTMEAKKPDDPPKCLECGSLNLVERCVQCDAYFCDEHFFTCIRCDDAHCTVCASVPLDQHTFA